MDIARETWENGDPVTDKLKLSTIQYIEKLQRNIKTAMSMASENMQQAQHKMKTQFDKQCSVRVLQPGDKALLLRPSSSSKIMAEWIGPIDVLQRCENDNYKVKIGKRIAKYHINSLRKYHEAETDCHATTVNVIIDADTDDCDDLITPDINTDGDADACDALCDVSLGDKLTSEERSQLLQLLGQYGDVLTEKLGRTDWTEHVIRVTDDTPVYQTSYRIPDAMRDQVEYELRDMLQNGIIKFDDETKYKSPHLHL